MVNKLFEQYWGIVYCEIKQLFYSIEVKFIKTLTANLDLP